MCTNITTNCKSCENTMKQVTQEDFILPEFRGKDPNDYEFTQTGKIVRKNRWEQGFRTIASIFVNPRGDFEIDDIVKKVDSLHKAAKLMASNYWHMTDDNKFRCRYCDQSITFDGKTSANNIIHMEICPVKIIKDHDKN